MENNLEIKPVENQAIQVSQTRAIEEVRGQIIVARQFPRDSLTAFSLLMRECERYSFAVMSQWSFPRGGQTITGASIRLVETAARLYGNINYGWRSTLKEQNLSRVETFAWDMQNNVRESLEFEMPHERHTKKGITILTDPRDIYELVANQASRRVRSCLERIIPRDFIEEACRVCDETIARGDGKTSKEDRLRKMIKTFDDLGVSKEMLEKRLSHKIEAIIEPEIVNLQKIYYSITEGISKREDFFDLTGKANDLFEKNPELIINLLQEEGKNHDSN